MHELSVFDFSSARDYLIARVQEEKKRRGFSVRRFSQRSGIGSHSLLVLILQKKRTLTPKQAVVIAEALKLTTPEKLYFSAISHVENARDDLERALYSQLAAEVTPASRFSVREVEEYTMIAHWVHMVVLATADTRRIDLNAHAIAQALKFKVTEEEVTQAIDRLLALGLIKQEGSTLVAQFASVTTRDEVSNLGAREYHRQVADLAREAVTQLPLNQREFQSFAVAIPKSEMALAKEMIRKFRSSFCRAFANKIPDEVFQMNIHLFQMTDFNPSMPTLNPSQTAEEIPHVLS